MVTLSFWYKQASAKEIKRSWINLVPLLGFERVGSLEGSGSWDYVRLDGIPVFFGISERVGKHVTVDIFSRQDETIPYLEVALRRLYGQRHTLLPSESFLVEGVEESSGPLLLYWKGSAEKLIEQIALYATPQIRVGSISLCGDINDLRQIAENYALRTKVIRDNLWVDFGWSRVSDSWCHDWTEQASEREHCE